MFSSHLLCIMDIRWWRAIVLKLVSVILILVLRFKIFFFIFLIDDLCVVLLAPNVIIMISRTFQPLFCIFSKRKAYFSNFSCIFLYENPSLI